MSIIDTHAHLTSREYSEDLAGVLERAQQAGVNQWITVGTSLSDSAAAIQLSQKYEGMYAAVGIHPHEAEKEQDGYIEKLRMLAMTEKVKAIGEAGLDYHYEFSKKERQKQVFIEQLDLADKLSLPVIVHCREALKDCLEILDQERDNVPIVFHCFSGDTEQAKTLIDRGYFISFTGVITFKNAQEAQKAAQYVPLERIMLETDCPYLSPEPRRGVRPNEPALLVHTADKLAQLKSLSTQETIEAVTKNSQEFFGIE